MKHSKKSSSKFMNDINSIFNNVYFLYFLLLLAVGYLFILLTMNNFNAIGFFILLGIIIYSYTKNMAIILSTCILFTLVIFPIKYKEGMETNDATTANTSVNSQGGSPTNPVTEPTASPSSLNLPVIDPLQPQAGISEEDKNKTIPVPNTEKSSSIDSFTGGLSGQSRLDPAATMTQAFTNLENMLGGEGISKLSTDTEGLINNQAKLFKTIENMTPLINQATQLMNKFSKF